MQRHLALLSLVFPLATGCGSDSTPTPQDAATPQDVAAPQDTAPQDTAAPEDVPATVDVPVAADVAADSGGGTVPVLNDCAAADYTDQTAGADTDRVVRPRGTTGYTPRCLTVRAGQSVTFEMNFATHPLVPGVPHGSSAGATSPNPIARQTSGTTYTVAMMNAGYYPFHCNVHGHVGMAGVVRVTP